MAMLGDDGTGYELAAKLESHGVWRTWLGDSHYSTFLHSLSSPSAWRSFMSPSNSAAKSDIQLQLRVRALLFDKASVSLFLPSSSSSSSSIISSLNPSYLQLHADDVYFTLEDVAPNRDSKVQLQKLKQEDMPETWYHQFIENYKNSRPYMVSFANRESDKRNPGEMSNYLKLLERHKRRRVGFKEDDNGGLGNSSSDNSHDSSCFFPETMFMMNCVPDSAVAPRSLSDEKKKVEFNGVLDSLPKMFTKSSSSIMLERLGIRPEYLSMEQGRGPGQSLSKVGSDGSKRVLGEEQAIQMSKKVLARVLINMGFEGATEIPIEVLSQFLSCHISKLGRILKVLADSYRKQCSSTELIKMFLQAGGNSLATLSEHVKDTRPTLPKTLQQSLQLPQQSLQPPQQSLQPHQQSLQFPQQSLQFPQQSLQLPQQIPRQMHPQLSQIVRPPNLTQQQLEMLRRRQAVSPRPLMNADKDRPMVEVKLENSPEMPMDNNAFSAMNSRQAQFQWRQQQQMAAFQRINNQLRQPASTQMPQMHSPNAGTVRAQPVKVEGFQELMGGDSSMKQNSDESKLTSPSK